MILLSIVLFIALIGVLSYHKSSLVLSTIVLLAYTAAMGAANIWSYWMLLPVALVLLPFVITPIRQSLFSSKAMAMFQKVMPPMSRTEKKRLMQELLGGKVTYFAAHQIGTSFTTTQNRN